MSGIAGGSCTGGSCTGGCIKVAEEGGGGLGREELLNEAELLNSAGEGRSDMLYESWGVYVLIVSPVSSYTINFWHSLESLERTNSIFHRSR